MSLEAKVHEIDKALAAHLAACATSTASMGREIKGLKQVLWWAGTAIMGGQFVVIAALLKVLFHW